MCVCVTEIGTSIIVQEHNFQSYVHNIWLTEGEGELGEGIVNNVYHNCKV